MNRKRQQVRKHMAGRAGRLALMAAVGLTATVGVAVGATVAASSYTDSQGVYHGCVNNGSGLLRVVVPGDPCKTPETAIDWNRAGSQGQQGIQGPKGDPGPAGSAFIGSPCAVPPNSAPGTVQMSIAAGGAISLSCTGPIIGGSGPPSELCNGIDDDQNGLVDDMPATPVPHGFEGCISAQLILFCDPGWISADGSESNGCETPVSLATRRPLAGS